MKLKLKSRIIAFAILPFCLPLMIPGLLKHIFYTISILTEEIGTWFERIDLYLGSKSQKFFKWLNK